MRTTHRSRRSIPARSTFAGFRFPPDVIVLAVRWYLRFGLSYRDVEELLIERGVEVDHVTIYRWVLRYRQGAGVPGGVGGAAAGVLASHRPVRQQSGRVRPWEAEGAAGSDARPQTGPQCQGGHRRTRLGAEPSARTLRAGGGGVHQPASGGRIRAGLGDPIPGGWPSACPGSAQRNSTHCPPWRLGPWDLSIAGHADQAEVPPIGGGGSTGTRAARRLPPPL
jgi:hypothetical protein